MFSAIMKGKTTVKITEDIITSSIFDNLLLLPDDLFWKILRTSCYNYDKMPLCAGQLLEYEFWPHWNNENTKNGNYVEPDFYIRFENFDIIGEVKRVNNLQEREQWEKEIISYLNEYSDGENKKRVFLIAIDGIINEENEVVEIENKGKFNVFKSRWSKILDVCLNFSKELRSNSFINVNSKKRLIDIVINYLRFYGFLDFSWLCEIIQKDLEIRNYNNSIEQLKMIGL